MRQMSRQRPQRKYSFDDDPDHQKQLEAWRDKWISNAFSTRPPDWPVVVEAVEGLYRAADLVPPPPHRADELPAAGYPVVRGEAGGNTHLLLPGFDTTCYYTPTTDGGLRLGVLTVPDRGSAVLHHPEHGYLGIGPGTYELTRQREQADEIRMVAD